MSYVATSLSCLVQDPLAHPLEPSPRTWVSAQAEGHVYHFPLCTPKVAVLRLSVYLRHMHGHTHRGHGHGWSQRWPQTRCCFQQIPHSGLTPDKGTGSHNPSSSRAGRGRRSLLHHTNTFMASLPGSQPPLPDRQAQLGAHRTHAALTLFSQAHYTCRSPKYQHGPSGCPIPLTDLGLPTHWLVQLGACQ